MLVLRICRRIEKMAFNDCRRKRSNEESWMGKLFKGIGSDLTAWICQEI